MKKINYYVTACLMILLSTAISAQTTVLGYFPSYRSTSVVRYDKLTDLAFAFINPDANGNLITNSPSDAIFGFDNNKFLTVKAGCQTNNVKLWIALGGADPGDQRSNRLTSVSNNSTSRNKLVSDLVSFAVSNDLYGIDVDWEFPKTTSAKAGHLALLQALKTAIASSGKPSLKVSIAVGGEYKGTVNHTQYLDASLFSSNASLVDVWHLMAYDFPSSYGSNHSSYVDALGCVEAFKSLGVPYNKMVLGVPFYARNATRSSDQMYSQLGANNTNYQSDLSNGWYYNGKPTLESKMDLIVSKGGLGILIWDIGQDNAAGNFSLLDAIDAKAKNLCPVPNPNLGPDKGVCAGQSTTLDPGVTASGRSFLWYKNNTSTGQTSSTISVNTAGTYKVAISQSGCTREDEIVIVSGSSVTTTGANGCNNVSLNLSVNNPDGAKTYKWFSAASGGTQLATGTTYSAIFPTKTTVYVEESAAGVNTYTTTPAAIPSGKFHAWAGTQYTYRVAQRIVVDQDLTIKSIRSLVSARSGASFYVKVQNSSNLTEVKKVGPFTLAGDNTSQTFVANYFDVTTNITLTPGSYFISLDPVTGSEGNYGFINGHQEVNTQTGVYNLYAGMYQSSATVSFSETDMGAAYGPFINWVIETGANASCGRTSATATVQQCGPPAITILSPTVKDYSRDAAISLSASVTDEGSVSSVIFEIYNGATLVSTVTANAGAAASYTASWTPTVIGADYSFKVTAKDNDNNTSTSTVKFTVSSPVGVGTLSAESVQLFPNPSESSFQLNVGSVANFDVFVYTISGQLVESQRVGSNATSFGSNLTSGLYVVKVVSSAGTFQTQVVKK